MKKLLLSIIILTLTASVLAVNCSAAQLKTIDSITYKVSEDGSLTEKFTGWAKSSSSGKRYYYSEGKRLKGANILSDGDRYVFDENGEYLFKRSLKDGLYIEFGGPENSDISMAEGVISFSVRHPESKAVSGGDGENFSLYAYKDEKWIMVQRKGNENGEVVSKDIGVISETGYLNHYSLSLSAYDYDFEPGLYRVKVNASAPDFAGNEVTGEFNLILSPTETGYYLKRENGGDMIVVFRTYDGDGATMTKPEAIMMNNQSENDALFDGLNTGDKIKITYSGLMMLSFPPRISVSDCELIERGAEENIPQSVYDGLSALEIDISQLIPR